MKKRIRSVGYPAFPLETSEVDFQKAKNNLGNGPHSRVDFAKAFELKESTVHRRIASMVHYNLLSSMKDQKGFYNYTELGQRISSPISEEELSTSRESAALQPVLFQRIYSTYENEGLPEMLSNILTRADFGIGTKSVADDVVRIFRATMEYAGLLKGNEFTNNSNQSDRIESNEELSGQDPNLENVVQAETSPKTAPPATFVEAVMPGSHRQFQIPISLDRSAVLGIPEPVDPSDLDAVAAWIEFMKSRI